MPFCLILGLALLGQAPPKADPDQFPLALHRSMEIDDLDREIQRLHDTVLLKKSQVAASQRLAQRGLISRGDLERENAEFRYQEAREAEAVAFRSLKAYERDVIGQAVPSDERKAYSLLLDWVRKQLGIAQVDVDYRAYQLKQTRALFNRSAVNRQELEDAELAYNTAEASLALSRSREAQVLMELAARSGEKPYDPEEYHRLKSESLKARVHYFEINADGARRRLEIARERSRHGLIPASEVGLFEKGAADADASLAGERKALERHEADRPTTRPRPRGGSKPAQPAALNGVPS
jgi:outer membrane protein TolC